jgi:peroxin-5
MLAELEQAEALSYLYRWLKNHPKYGILAPPQQPDNLFYNDVSTPLDLQLTIV